MERDETRPQPQHTTPVGVGHDEPHTSTLPVRPVGLDAGAPAQPVLPTTQAPDEAMSASSTEPRWANLPYHRLAHVTPRSGRWWRPLVMLLMFVVTTLVVAAVATGLAFAVHAIFPELRRPTEDLGDSRNPADFFYGFLSVALFLPVVWVAVRVGGRRGTIHSVFGHYRWEFMARAARVVVPVSAVAVLAPIFLFDADTLTTTTRSTTLWILLFAVVLVPLQAAAEEYVFRGLLPQMIGTWLRSPVWGVLVAAPLFTVLHGYDAVGLVDIALFAVCTAYLAWKSGGLELPVLLHVSNNLFIGLITPFVPDALAQGETELWSVVWSAVTTLVLTVWMSRFVDREYGLTRFQPVVRPALTRAV